MDKEKNPPYPYWKEEEMRWVLYYDIEKYNENRNYI
jgi:hypothetical protein